MPGLRKNFKKKKGNFHVCGKPVTMLVVQVSWECRLETLIIINNNYQIDNNNNRKKTQASLTKTDVITVVVSEVNLVGSEKD